MIASPLALNRGWRARRFDIGKLLHTAEGNRRISILSIRNLSDSERMFFSSAGVLNEMLSWTTGSVRHHQHAGHPF